jgi:eukaryotic-like serine/threonine-protein kinase
VVKVADFGLARAYADGTATQAGGTVQGTVQYLSPEQIRGEPADPRSDLYSLGVVTYELLTGKLPFAGETAMSIAFKHLSGRVPRPSAVVPTIPSELDGFVLSATDRDRELRPESATEMRRDLESILPGLPAARSLAAVVDDLPEIDPDGAATERVPVVGAATATIPRVERTKRRRWRRLSGFVLLIAALAATAWGVWTYVIPHHAQVPTLVGTPVDQARAQLEDLGLAVKLGSGVHRMQIPAGDVAAIRPAAGTTLERGQAVTLIPSLGPPPVPVPSLVGQTIEEAQVTLQKAHLRLGEQTPRYSELPVGQIVAQHPTGSAPRGSAIAVDVSKGPAPVAIQPVVGKAKDEATRILEGQGFHVAYKTKFSADVARDSVIAQNPDAGEKLQPGETVTLTISLGPKHFPCPDFNGLSRAAAIALADEYGLKATFVDVTPTPGTIVLNQSVAAGSSIGYGDPITLYLV